MRDARAVCMLCHARQCLQAAVPAAERGTISRSSAVSSRWYATARLGARQLSTNATGTKPGNEGATAANKERRPSQFSPGTRKHNRPNRKPRPRQTEDAALAAFRDIVEKQHQSESGQSKEQTPEERMEQRLSLALDPTKLGEAHKKLEEEQRKRQDEQKPSGRQLQAGLDLYQQLIKLTRLRSQPNITAADQFAFFDTAMYPQMAEAPRDLTNIFRQAAQQVARDVSTAKLRDYKSTDLPSVARITLIRRQFDLLNSPGPWVPLVLGLVEEVRRAAAATASQAGQGTEDVAQLQKTKEALVGDLVETWRMFSLPDMVVGDQDALDKSPANEFRLPKLDAALLSKSARFRNILLALAFLFPRYAPQQLRSTIPVVIATYTVLTDPAIRTPETDEKAQEFLQAVEYILSSVQVDRSVVADMFIGQPELGSYVLSRWPLVQYQPARQSKSLASGSRAGSKGIASLSTIHREIGHALKTRNMEQCEATWDKFWAAVTVPDAEGAEMLRNSGGIFDYFIMVFTAMRMPNRAITVWNVMTMAGVKPTLRTWTSFIEGCKLASNPSGIHNIWDKLMASGLPADTAVWTARISGLIQAGDADAGIKALEEMQRTWEIAEKEKAATATATEVNTEGGPRPGTIATTIHAVKPTIEPVNAAIAGLLRRGDLVSAKQILAWAGQHGIEPDRITFNTILRPLVREGKSDEVAGLLDLMRNLDLQPDEATVTILLDGAFGGGALADRSPTAQVEVVRGVLAEVEAAGLEANQQTYAKMVYLLLGGGDQEKSKKGMKAKMMYPAADDSAVEVVLDRMRGQGVPVSSHIYTILAEHYFSRDPPDLDAVRYLIETGEVRRQSQEGREAAAAEHGENPRSLSTTSFASSPLFDRVFWERAVRGYAQAGDVVSAQACYAHIADSLSVTTSTLEDLLRALVDSGNWEAAQELVSKAQAQKALLVQGGESPASADSRLFRHRFWHLAAKHGLLQM